MKMDASQMTVVCVAVLGLMASPLFAQEDSGNSGSVTAGRSALTAANEAYASSSDPEVIKAALIQILNEAAATGDQESMKFVIAAVMMAGGAENKELGKEAVDSSAIYASYPDLAAQTVADAIAWMAQTQSQQASGQGGQSGQGRGNGGNGGGGVGRGLGNEYGLWNAFIHRDGDVPATGV